MRIREITESATAGSTSAGNIASVINPGSTLPKSARTAGTTMNTAYVGKPGGPSGTKTPPQPKPKKVKPTDNALDKNVGFFTGGMLKR
jgi:hypothetical protein